MSDINIEVEADDVTEMIDHVRERVMDYRLQRFLGGPATAYMRDRINRRFADEGDDVVGRWADLRPATQNIRARQGFGARHPINVRTGQMFRFIKTTRVSGTTLTMPGTNPTGQMRKKLMTAAVGGFAPGRKRFVPMAPTVPRPVLGMNDRDRAAVETRLLKWINEGGKS
jgi:hypothetical protein